jgi:hypothetical protein
LALSSDDKGRDGGGDVGKGGEGSSRAEATGGRLLVLCEGAVREVHPRLEGEATVHDSSLLHAVSRVTGARVRYSLIIFYDLA